MPRPAWLAPLAAFIIACVIACGSTTGSSSTQVASPSGPATYQPIKTAQCGSVPPSGHYLFQYRNRPGRPIVNITIHHTRVVCGQPFTEYVDFTYLGNWPTCSSSPHAPNSQRRPCTEPFKQGPDQRSATLNGGAGQWRPTEGETALHVVCQVISNTTLSQGTLEDDHPGGPVASNVWNRIIDQRIQGGVGYINDIWMGDAGFRGRRCKQ